jgi:ribosome-associated translation inhibitor RaiA
MKIINTSPVLLTIVSNLPKELSGVEKKKVNSDLKKLATWIDKQEKIQLLRFSSDTVYSPEKKPVLFEVNLEIETKTTNYFASNKDVDFFEAIDEVIEQVKKQTRRSN